MKPKKIVALIPARGGSKRLPGKNIKMMNGQPLLHYSIRAAQNAHIDEVWVSTDSKEIACWAKKGGARVLDRPSEFAQDTSQTEEVISHFTSNVDYDILILLEPTYPLTTHHDVRGALNIFLSKKYDSVLSLEEIIAWEWIKNERGIKPIFDIHSRPRSQDMNPRFIETGGIFITTKDCFKKSGSRVSGHIGYYLMSHFSIEVDTLEDFEIAASII